MQNKLHSTRQAAVLSGHIAAPALCAAKPRVLGAWERLGILARYPSSSPCVGVCCPRASCGSATITKATGCGERSPGAEKIRPTRDQGRITCSQPRPGRCCLLRCSLHVRQTARNSRRRQWITYRISVRREYLGGGHSRWWPPCGEPTNEPRWCVSRADHRLDRNGKSLPAWGCGFFRRGTSADLGFQACCMNPRTG